MEDTPEYGTPEMKERESGVRCFDFNKTLLGGRLTSNPELRYTPSSTPVCDFQVASNEYRKDADGNSQEEVLFIGCVVWGKLAEVCSNHLEKGSPVFIEGRLKLDRWEKDGQPRSKHKLRVDNIRFLGHKKDD